MIEILGRSGEPEAKNCPAFICDACRKQVTHGGNIIWGQTVDVEPRLSTPLFVAHKGTCDVAVQRALEDRYGRDEWLWQWEAVSAFIKRLTHNLGYSFADDTEGRYHEQRVAFPPASP